MDFFTNLMISSVTLPALKDCRGGFNLQSSGSVDCGPFEKEKGPSSVIKGTFKCANKVSNPGNAANNPSSSGKKGAATLTVIPSWLLAAAGLVAGLMSMM